MAGLHDWWAHLVGQVQRLQQTAPAIPVPGLHTYPIRLDGGERRVHLRVHADGSGVLFVDVTDVIHLNATAVHMVSLALEQVPLAEARKRVAQHYRGASKSELADAVSAMYGMVAQLRADSSGCPVCDLAPMLAFQRLFSTPVTAPYKADVALTYACNNSCPHCYNEPDRFTMPSLSRDGWFRVLDQLAAAGIPHIILTGGEPTLHSALPDIIRHADGLGQIVGMNTNGRRLGEPGFAAELVAAGLNHVQITLESCYPEVHDAMVGAPGAFEETVHGIRNALAAGLHTITNTTVTRQNQDHVLEIVSFVASLGLGTFAMNGIIYAGGGVRTPDAIAAEEMAAVLAAVRDEAVAQDLHFLWYTVTDYCRLSPVALGLPPKRCNAAEYSICIEPNADVLPCQSYYEAAGNLLDDPWDSIWNSELFRRFRDREKAPEAAGLPPACWDCPDLELCGGGCPLERAALQGTTQARSSLRGAERGCGRRPPAPTGRSSRSGGQGRSDGDAVPRASQAAALLTSCDQERL